MLRAAKAFRFIGIMPLIGCPKDCDRNVVKRPAIDKSSAHTAKPPCGCGFRNGTQLIILASTCTSGQKTMAGAKGRFWRASRLLGPARAAGGDALGGKHQLACWQSGRA